MRTPAWAFDGGPFSRLYRNGRWFCDLDGRKNWRGEWFGIGHRMGGFWMLQVWKLRLGRTR